MSTDDTTRESLAARTSSREWPNEVQVVMVGIANRLAWPSMHWGTEDVHPDAWPHIAAAAADAVLASDWLAAHVAAALAAERERINDAALDSVRKFVTANRSTIAYLRRAAADPVYESDSAASAHLQSRAGGMEDVVDRLDGLAARIASTSTESVDFDEREPGACGECNQIADFAWDLNHPPVNDAPVATCRLHGDLAPGWVYYRDDLAHGHEDQASPEVKG